MNYYNENDPKAAAWLRELIKQGCISEGVVDERSIVDVHACDIAGYKQCHFFAGIGGWSYALRLAGVSDDEPLWTGSCPCPPFSAAGKKKKCPKCGDRPIPHPRKTGIFACVECGHEWFADGRHLWPEFHRLIHQRQPSTVFGEQVAGTDGEIWLAGIRATLEESKYRVGSGDICAAGIGTPQIRQRLWWVGYTKCKRLEGWSGTERADLGAIRQIESCGIPSRLEHATSDGREQRWPESSGRSIASGCSVGWVACANCRERNEWKLAHTQNGELLESFRCSSPWNLFGLLPCTDGKARRIEPGTFPLAHGVSGRVGLLRGYGNAIVPQVAAEFIQAFYEALHDVRSNVLTFPQESY